MIICHPLKLIFIKTKKVGGTSFEIALSSYCDENSIITPISPKDEEIRKALSYPGPQNHQTQTWPDGNEGKQAFFNHMTAGQIRAAVPQEIWESYTKITIWRDPYDAIISRYYWEGMDKRNIPFDLFVENFRSVLSENRRIAPLGGPNSPDIFLRYEHLEEDVNALGVDDLWARFSSLSAKAALRPKSGADPATLFAKHPDTADLIEQEAASEIARFGYTRPNPTPAPGTAEHAPPRASGDTPSVSAPSDSSQPDFIFTLSAGRTGTAWLARFLGDNLNIPSVHEPLGLDAYGTRLPSISHMRHFNTYGMNGPLCDFWEGKLSELQAPYAESNHTLGKCGLIEALIDHGLAPRTTIIILRRNLAKQIASYVVRNDFFNITIPWQWYLHPDYHNKIVDPAPLKHLGDVGSAIWYALEMEARYAYYKHIYGGQLQFIEATLEDAVTPDGAAKLLRALRHKGHPKLPPKANASPQNGNITDTLVAEVETLLSRVNFDAEEAALAFIQRGNRLDVPALPRQCAAAGKVAAE
ncbi:hypothetical protein PhaeoP23_01390 [Phaeobacter piscinae]|uniref:Sulfotransferase family protein n=1 Tax=Phaeobacter piscinae TaxID=1580596 RepID=A0ABN5DE37_9RHOB|nr:hypothetical protein [Phaeobacter piscinae]ATG35539.1 hypothetical protein PhaeoP36_01390 [Phaeobacter piscinae]AUQ86059.1 hypothetical protein PhaeoP42_01390 [Phaeobacter piscinae]AUR23943.1 hypothetical protein PhaeoP23_01390 [Phaeobacter piscinae]